MTPPAATTHNRFTEHFFQGICACSCTECTRKVGDAVICTCDQCPPGRCGSRVGGKGVPEAAAAGVAERMRRIAQGGKGAAQ